MKFTIGWLKDYLEFDSSIHDLCNKLTDLGLEVEKIIDPKKNLGDFFVVKILKKTPHPNADRLSLCEVDNGTEKMTIVCGAPNARENLITVLAPVGTRIYPGKINEFKIGKSKIRGEESNGMLCSEQELQISDSSEGIIELSEKYKIGKKYSDYFSDEDIIIEIAITPNRVDCAGVYGIARDLFASGFGKLKKKNIPSIKNNFETDLRLTNKLKNSDCPNFTLRLIKNVKNIPSSEKIIARFKKTGLKVISSLVDITNFITLDYCRPLHVFDYDKINGDITVRHSVKGEKFVGLDSEEYELDSGMIVICDEIGIISLAGILGGERTGCDENTKNVLLESAYFKPSSIISTGRKLNIQSDARYRFERGIDPFSVIDGIQIASEMILKICGGEVGNIISDSEKNEKPEKIKIEKFFFNEVLGIEVSIDFVKDKLEKIGCTLKEEEDFLIVTPPSWRSDISIREDLVEEIARLYGYEKIPSKAFNLEINYSKNKTEETQKLRNKIKRLLVSRSIFEIITWSFTDEKVEQILNNKNNFIKLKNPISNDLSCLRSSLLTNLIMALKKNNNKNFDNLSFFEIGPIFYGSNSGEQSDYICAVRSGKFYEKNWIEKDRDFDFYDIKADLSAVLNIFGINIDNLRFSDSTKSYYHPGKSSSLYIGKENIGFLGEINPGVVNSIEIKNKIFAFELNLTSLLKYYKNTHQSKTEIQSSLYQASKRDFSFIVSKDYYSLDIIKTIRSINKKLIKEVNIFDNYEGKNIDEGKKALGFEIVIQSDFKTMTDKEINDISNKIISEIKQKYNAKLR